MNSVESRIYHFCVEQIFFSNSKNILQKEELAEKLKKIEIANEIKII